MIVNKRSLYFLRFLVDLLLLNLAFIIAAISAQSLEILLSHDHMFLLQMALNGLWLFSSNLINFYDDLNSRYFAFQFVNILKNTIAQALAAILFIFATKEDLFTRNFILYYSGLLIFFVTLRYIAFRKILKALRRKGKNIRSLLIIGTGEIGNNFYSVLKEHPDFGYRFIGFVDENNFAGTSHADQHKKVLGNINELDTILQNNKAEEAVIAISDTPPALLDTIIKICNRHAVKTHIIPDYFRYMSKKFRISMIGDFPIITVRSEPLDEVQWRFVKRIFDIIFSFIVIVCVLSWLIPFISIMIKMQSKGPAIFVQERIGVKSRRFKCYKFRTMHTELNQQSTFKPAAKDDTRIFPLGHWLRRTNIDELPQFINVFAGDMSIVGPRPHPLPFENKYKQFVDEIRMRQNVKPGITGWAQIHGLRGDVVDEEENTVRIKKRVEYDLWYIENWSFWLDIQIILLTVWQMIKGEAKGV